MADQSPFGGVVKAIPILGGVVGGLMDMFSPSRPPTYDVNRGYFDDSVEGPGWQDKFLGQAETIAGRDIDRSRYEQSRGMGLESRDLMLGELGDYDRRIREQALQSQQLARQQALSMAGGAPMSQQAQALRGASRGYTSAAQQIAADAGKQRWAQHQAAIGGLGTMRGQDLGMGGLDLGDEAQRQEDLIRRQQTMQAYRAMAEGRSQYGAGLGARGEDLQAGVQKTQLGIPSSGPTLPGALKTAANIAGNTFAYQSAADKARRSGGM